MGGAGSSSGQISTLGKLDLRLNGSVVGGLGDYSGNISGNVFHSLVIGGSLFGGFGSGSGSVSVANYNPDDPYAENSGSIQSGNLTIRGSLIGGAGDGSASITGGETSDGIPATIKSIVIGGDVRGGDGAGSASIGYSGIFPDFYTAGPTAESIHVRGTVLGGKGSVSAAIIGANFLAIGGDVRGGDGESSASLEAHGSHTVYMPLTHCFRTLWKSPMLVAHFQSAACLPEARAIPVGPFQPQTRTSKSPTMSSVGPVNDRRT